MNTRTVKYYSCSKCGLESTSLDFMIKHEGECIGVCKCEEHEFTYADLENCDITVTCPKCDDFLDMTLLEVLSEEEWSIKFMKACNEFIKTKIV